MKSQGSARVMATGIVAYPSASQRKEEKEVHIAVKSINFRVNTIFLQLISHEYNIELFVCQYSECERFIHGVNLKLSYMLKFG